MTLGEALAEVVLDRFLIIHSVVSEAFAEPKHRFGAGLREQAIETFETAGSQHGLPPVTNRRIVPRLAQRSASPSPTVYAARLAAPFPPPGVPPRTYSAQPEGRVS